MHATISNALRHLVYERDSYTCVLCDNPGADVHHVLARQHGGRNTVDNLATVCRLHHLQLHRTEWLPHDDYEDLQQRLCEYVNDAHAYDPP